MPDIDLKEAIALVKAAGYKVSKPRITSRSVLKTVGPTFVANWADDITTRMSIHTPDDNLDLKRAVRVSLAAYLSRTKGRGTAHIDQAHFERDGRVLAAYGEMSPTAFN